MMRKRNQKSLFDNILWYTIYLLPIILTICQYGQGVLNFTIEEWEDLSNTSGLLNYDVLEILRINLEGVFGIDGNNPIYGTFYNLFSDEGILPLFSEYPALLYGAYFVSVYIIHLAVDFLLFIPRLCHKWMNEFTQGD